MTPREQMIRDELVKIAAELEAAPDAAAQFATKEKAPEEHRSRYERAWLRTEVRRASERLRGLALSLDKPAKRGRSS